MKWGRPLDYPRWREYLRRHHDRFARRVEGGRLTCQACRGAGGRVEPVLDFGQGPWEDCGWCEGTGKVTPWLRGLWLQYRRQEAS